MNKFLTAAALISLILTCNISFAEPDLSIPEKTFNFGNVPQNSILSHTFWLVSSGSDTAGIIRIESSCKCMTAPLQSDIIPPGDSIPLTLIYESRRYHGFANHHAVISVSGMEREDTVNILADINQFPDSTFPIVIKPYKLDISRFDENIRDEIDFEITNNSNKDVSITMIHFPDTLGKIKMPDKIKAGQTEEGRLKLDDDMLEMSFDLTMTIETDDPDRSRFTIPIRRRIFGK